MTTLLADTSYLSESPYGLWGVIMVIFLLAMLCYNAWLDDADARRRGYYVLAAALVPGNSVCPASPASAHRAAVRVAAVHQKQYGTRKVHQGGYPEGRAEAEGFGEHTTEQRTEAGADIP